MGWVRSRVWVWLFSSTLSTTAFPADSGKTHHVAELLDKEGIGREFETVGAVRLQTEQLELAMHSGLGDPGLWRSPRTLQWVQLWVCE